MNKLLENVGIRGLHNQARVFVNDLPCVHDELLPSVAYSTGLQDYYSRIAGASLDSFRNEVICALTGTDKFSDLLLSFPRATLNPDTMAAHALALDGRGYEVRYRLMNLPEFARLSAERLILFVQGPYALNVELELSLSGMMPQIIHSQTLTGADVGAQEVYLADPAVDAAVSRSLDPARTTRLTLRISGSGTLLPQTRLAPDPAVPALDYRGGELLTYPYAALTGEIRFDVDGFISRHYDRLSHAFANRVAARLLSDKLTSVNLTIHTNTHREDTRVQIELCDEQVREHLKVAATALYFKAQSAEIAPVTPQPAIMIGGYV